MTSKSAPTELRFSAVWLWLFAFGGLALGCGIGFAVPPVGGWAVDTLPSVPGPLELAMTISPVWLVPIAAVVGLLAGLTLFDAARKESLALIVADDHVELSKDRREKYVPRAQVDAVFREAGDLVLVDRNRLRLARFGASDLGRRKIAAAFRKHGYPWLDRDDPFGVEFARWLDGMPGVDEDVNVLLRARRRAIADKKPLIIEEVDEKLIALGVDVRERKGEQLIRTVQRPS
ncbi:YqeB family protein [Nocardia lijiangensis]|uniref:YqeB family protein n=1 Tax=Nocardia lijiangensis TaxID=299618 RepID=UPI00082E3679|nr:hypothetical protein [Nocardia lijiangensis]